AAIRDDLAVTVDRPAADERPHDAAAKPPAQVCRDAASRLELGGARGPDAGGIDDGEVGVGARTDRALPVRDAEEPRGRRRDQARERGQGEPAPTSFAEQSG